MSEITLQVLAGGAELSANAYLLKAMGKHLLLDAGAPEPGKSAAGALAWVEALEAPDACWISHAHWDHLGALGALRARFPRLACVCAPATRDLAELVLKSDKERARHPAALAAGLQTVSERVYFDPMAFAAPPERRARDESSDNAAPPRFRAMSFPAGHIPGAQMLLVEVERPGEDAGTAARQPFRLLYTADFCGHDQPLTPGALFPRTGAQFQVDVMLMEGVLATQLQYDQVDYGAQADALVEEVRRGEGAVLIGVSRLASAAQVVGLLAQRKVPCVVHHALQPVVGVAFRAAGCDAALELVEFADERACSRALFAQKTVIAPGEDLARGTPAGRLLLELERCEGGAVLVLNRVRAASPAGKLLAAGKGGRAAQHVAHFLLPNHAPRSQLIAAALAVNPRRLLLVHGHRSQLYSLKRAIEKAGFRGTVEVPETGAELPL